MSGPLQRRPSRITIMVAPAQYVKLGHIAVAATGLSVKAMQQKIDRGQWVEGREWEWRDGRRFINLRAFEAWVAKGRNG